MRIYIPTMGRVDKQKTVERLGPDLCEKFGVTLVAPGEEAKELRKLYGESYGVIVVACAKKGIADTRQFILDFHAKSDAQSVVLMLDDDLPTWRQRGRVKNAKGEIPYTKATVDEIEEGLTTFGKLMTGYAHGSIGHALFCQLSPPAKFNSRMLRALAYNVALIPKGVKFRLQVMEDFDMELQLLTKGFKSITYNGIVQDQHDNNSPGGCSSYRTPAVQAAAAHKLAALWPDFVTVVTRAPKREWKGMPDRVDVRINWAKAAKAGGLK